jgi:hypothetical protein
VIAVLHVNDEQAQNELMGHVLPQTNRKETIFYVQSKHLHFPPSAAMLRHNKNI